MTEQLAEPLENTKPVPPITDLGVWTPSLPKPNPAGWYDVGPVWEEWRSFVRKAIGPGQRWYTIRTPSFHWAINSDTDLCMWHADGADRNGTWHRFVIMWSNVHPTLVLDRREEKPVQLLPWHAYIIDNRNCFHRTPLAAIGSNRWFARAYRRYAP